MKYIDIQNNGYAGVSFNLGVMSSDDFEFCYQRLVVADNEAILPTIITGSPKRMANSILAIRNLVDQDERYQKMFPAFHIEGPSISPVDGYRGAHPLEHIKPASPEVFKPLLEAAGGPQNVAMVTLAPECDKDFKTTRWLTEQGIIVSGGHSNAPYEILKEAVDVGLSFYTHLGNGCAQQIDRMDNMLWRVMSIEKLTVGLIPDGHHIKSWVLKNWIRWLGLDRCILTTDCVAAADAPDDFVMQDLVADVDRSGATPVCRVQGTPYLAGSAITMPLCYRNAIDDLALTEAEAEQLMYQNPKRIFAKWLS